MDVASVLGITLGCGLIVVSIGISEGASYNAFLDYPSMVMVIGGSLAACLLCFPIRDVLGTIGVVKNVFFNHSVDPGETIDQIVSLAETARRDGLLALENRLEEITDPFIVMGIQMAVDGTRPEVIEDVLRTEMESVHRRHLSGKSVVDQMGRFAPAFGMIGTLVGLIIMLGNMQDPDAIGPGMAVALITTLYGAILANVVFLPFAEKLGVLNKQELFVMEIVIRGVLGIQAGDNPRVIEQKLSTFIPRHRRAKKEQVE
ncbi:MAG: motility protein A [Planctomycetota bacterium]